MQENHSRCILISQGQQRVKSFRVQSSTAQTHRGLSEILNGEAHRVGSSAFPWRWRRRALLFVFQACTLSKGLLFPLQSTPWKCSLQSVPAPPPSSSPCIDFRRTQGGQGRAQHSRELLWGTIRALRSSGMLPWRAPAGRDGQKDPNPNSHGARAASTQLGMQIQLQLQCRSSEHPMGSESTSADCISSSLRSVWVLTPAC